MIYREIGQLPHRENIISSVNYETMLKKGIK